MRLKRNKEKHSRKRKIFFFITMFFIGIYLSFKYLEREVKFELDNAFTNYILDREYSNNSIINSFNNMLKPNIPKENKSKEKKDPVIYIYNSHQTEEYASNELFSFSPNVTMINYILESTFNSNNYQTLVEERSIKEMLNKNSWNYASSYKASRLYMEDAKLNNASLRYFIDVHRDSLKKDRTTVTIGDKQYAKILFLLGLENPNYNQNLDFINKINDKLNALYPGLSKGILKKSGTGVNGVYNQDFSPYTILVEFGGVDNTTYEILNTSLAFSKCFLEVLNEIEN